MRVSKHCPTCGSSDIARVGIEATWHECEQRLVYHETSDSAWICERCGEFDEARDVALPMDVDFYASKRDAADSLFIQALASKERAARDAAWLASVRPIPAASE